MHLPLLPAMLGFLLFNAGLGAPLRELIELRRTPKKGAVLLAGLIGNLATPLTMILVVAASLGLWHNPDDVSQILTGLALVAAMPIADASTAWAQNANGSLVVSLVLVLLTTLLILRTVGLPDDRRLFGRLARTRIRRGRGFPRRMGDRSVAARNAGC